MCFFLTIEQLTRWMIFLSTNVPNKSSALIQFEIAMSGNKIARTIIIWNERLLSCHVINIRFDFSSFHSTINFVIFFFLFTIVLHWIFSPFLSMVLIIFVQKVSLDEFPFSFRSNNKPSNSTEILLFSFVMKKKNEISTINQIQHYRRY